jgi:hypothetical protein
VVRAVRAAAPFPNYPPRALVGEDGRILPARWRFELAWGDALPRLALPGVKARPLSPHFLEKGEGMR